MSDAGFDMDLATAALLADNHDVRVLLKVLAKQLAGALGERLSVERQGGLLHKSDEVKAIRATLGGEEFIAELSGGRIETAIGHTSGGIRIRTERVGVDEWLQRLLKALQGEAESSQEARLALENIVIGGQA